jgi:presqualene diphosphate synthase
MSAAMTETGTPNAGRASGSSFYAAMRILPKPQREAMFAIYGFGRQVDDIADSPGPRAERLAALAEWRRSIDALYQGHPNGQTEDLVEPVRSFGLEKADFLAVIDGMEMDVLADIRAPSWSELDLYCDRVASAVGRLSVRIFGLEIKPGRDLAYHLGRALQLTNILRDLDEDAGVGRLYLPREALHQAGIETTEPAAALADPALDRACGEVIAVARQHFERAHAIMAASSRRAVRAPRIMGEVYRLILERVAERGFAPPRLPVRLGRARLTFILMRYAFI